MFVIADVGGGDQRGMEALLRHTALVAGDPPHTAIRSELQFLHVGVLGAVQHIDLQPAESRVALSQHLGGSVRQL